MGSGARPYCFMLENVTIWGKFNFDLIKSHCIVIFGAPSASFTHSSSQRRAFTRGHLGTEKSCIPRKERGLLWHSKARGKLLQFSLSSCSLDREGLIIPFSPTMDLGLKKINMDLRKCLLGVRQLFAEWDRFCQNTYSWIFTDKNLITCYTGPMLHHFLGL